MKFLNCQDHVHFNTKYIQNISVNTQESKKFQNINILSQISVSENALLISLFKITLMCSNILQ